MAELIGERGGIRYRLKLNAKKRTSFIEPQRYDYSLWANSSCLVSAQTELQELYGLLQVQQVGELFQRVGYLKEKQAPFMLGAHDVSGIPHESLCLLAETDFMHVMLWHQKSGYCAYVHLNDPAVPVRGDADCRLCACFCITEEHAQSFGNAVVAEAAVAEMLEEQLQDRYLAASRC